ncbi:MAG: hypothetical protein NXI30_03680 [bacterium]|nr:hypothetical protein [bacterium]
MAILFGPCALASSVERPEEHPAIRNLMLLSVGFLLVTGIWHLFTNRSPEKKIRGDRA